MAGFPLIDKREATPTICSMNTHTAPKSEAAKLARIVEHLKSNPKDREKVLAVLSSWQNRDSVKVVLNAIGQAT